MNFRSGLVVGYRQIERRLEIVVVRDRLAAGTEVSVRIQHLAEELDLFLRQSRFAARRVENRLVARGGPRPRCNSRPGDAGY